LRKLRGNRLAVAGLCAYLSTWRVLLFTCEATFPVADKQVNGGWLWQDPGPATWRPPETSGSRENPVSTAAAGPPPSFPNAKGAPGARHQGSADEFSDGAVRSLGPGSVRARAQVPGTSAPATSHLQQQ